MGVLSSAIDECLSNPGMLRAWIMLIALFGLASAAGSIFYEELDESIVGETVRNLERQVEPAVEEAQGIQALLTLFTTILLRNLTTTIILALTSFTVVMPIAVIGYNGLLVGYIASSAISEGVRLPVTFLLLALHGIVEIPAVTLVAAVALSRVSLGFKAAFSASIRVLPLALVLLAVAAFVESFITFNIAPLFI